jgi:hypothetical protein
MSSVSISKKSIEKSQAGDSLHITFNGKLIASLPKTLSSIFEAVEKSKYILELTENWDGEDAARYDFDVWKKSVLFISKLSVKIFTNFGQIVKTPKIYHGPNGSVDIYWENESFNLLINIPETGMATFYGDNYQNNKIEGSFEPATISLNIFPFLIELNG